MPLPEHPLCLLVICSKQQHMHVIYELSLRPSSFGLTNCCKQRTIKLVRKLVSLKTCQNIYLLGHARARATYSLINSLQTEPRRRTQLSVQGTGSGSILHQRHHQQAGWTTRLTFPNACRTRMSKSSWSPT